jgi:hypothetical protein
MRYINKSDGGASDMSTRVLAREAFLGLRLLLPQYPAQ